MRCPPCMPGVTANDATVNTWYAPLGQPFTPDTVTEGSNCEPSKQSSVVLSGGAPLPSTSMPSDCSVVAVMRTHLYGAFAVPDSDVTELTYRSFTVVAVLNQFDRYSVPA